MTPSITAPSALKSGLSAVELSTLSNGMQLAWLPQANAPRLALNFFMPGGNLIDGKPGLSDLVDRLLMKGTDTRSQEQIAELLDGSSLELDIDTRRDSTILSAVMLPEDLDESLELIQDLMYHATLADYEKEKQQMAGEIQMELDSPQSRASDLLIRTVFGGTPYGVTSTVFLEHMDALSSLEPLREHYFGAYRPERMVVSASGPMSGDVLAKKLEAHFPKRGVGQSLTVSEATQKALRAHGIPTSKLVNVAKDDSAQAHIYKAWMAPALDSDDTYPISVMNTLFGGAGLSARLFLELRDKQGLAYTVRSSFDAYRYSGLYKIYIGTEPSNKEKCLTGFEVECGKLINELVSAQELAETKTNMLGRRQVFLETSSQWAAYIGGSLAQGRTLAQLAEYEDRILAVTSADIQRVSQQIFNSPSVISIVGPSSIF